MSSSRCRLRWVAAAGLVLSLAACGSRVEPSQVAEGAGPAGVSGAPAESGGATGGAPGGAEDSSGAGDDGVAGHQAAGSGTSPGGGVGAPAGSGSGSATGGVEAASCDGLREQVGLTDDEVVLANVADLAGPVPGLFESARDGARAYVEFFNATSDLCGRELRLLSLDSRTDAGADQTAYAEACERAFAAVGSISIFDSGGAGTAEDCGLPDIRSASLTRDRTECATCFPVQAGEIGVVGDAIFRFFRQQDRAATDRAAFLYVDVGGAPDLAKSFSEAAAAAGFGIEMLTGIDVAEFNYAPYVQQLQDRDIGYVFFVGADQQVVNFAEAMRQQDYRPGIFTVTQTQYTSGFVEQGGAAVEGATVPLPHPAFTSGNAELRLYRAWLQQVRPGAEPTSFGLFAWSATRLFVEKALALGGRLTRETLLAAVRAEHSWEANGLHTTMDVGGKRTYRCSSVLRLEDGAWRQVSPRDYLCGRLITTSVAR